MHAFLSTRFSTDDTQNDKNDDDDDDDDDDDTCLTNIRRTAGQRRIRTVDIILIEPVKRM